MSTPPSLSRRRFFQLSGLAAAGVSLAACSDVFPTAPAALPAESEAPTPDEALQRLMEGNQRYVSDKTVDPNQSAARRAALAAGQNPFAIIFSCVDSRVPPEIVFDRGLGDLFVIRTAGQVIDNAVLGSIEFGVFELGIPLVMVMGHEKCGAVKATIETIESGGTARAQIGTLVDAIRPAVEESEGAEGDELLDKAIHRNIEFVVAQLKTSPIISDALTVGTVKVVGSRYDLDSGMVEMVVS